MLRDLFVFSIVGIGVTYSLRTPFYALLFYLWYAYFRPENWVWGDHLRSLNLSFVIGLYLIVLVPVSAERERLRFDVRAALLFLFLTQTLISTVFSDFIWYSWGYWQDFAKSTLITYFIAMLAADRSRFRLVLFVMAYSLGLEAAKQGWAQFVLNPGAANHNVVAFLGDNNGVAVGMAMLIPVLSALAQTSSTRLEAFVHRFFLVGIVYRTISTYSRGGFLTLCFLGIVSFLRARRKVRTLIGTALVIWGVSSVLPQEFWDRMQTITAPAEERDESAAGRLHFWWVAIAMANDRPFTGVGHNAYNPSYNAYDFSGLTYSGARSVHSSWFGVLAEQGYTGFILFVAILGLAMASCRKVRKLTKGKDELRDLHIYATALQLSLLAFAIGGSFVIFHYVEMLWHCIGLTMALRTIAVNATAPVTQPSNAALVSAMARAIHPAVRASPRAALR